MYFYALRTVLNLSRSTEYKDCLRPASMDTLTQDVLLRL